MRLLTALIVVTGCTVDGPVAELSQAVGEPMNGFPSPAERLGMMAINRARSDPSTVKGPNSAIYPAAAPVLWHYDLSRGSRFHATNLESAKVQLMHTSPCTLSNMVGVNGCDGTVACACAAPVPQMCAACAQVAPINNCGTDNCTRIHYFSALANCAEIGAAGFATPFDSVGGPGTQFAGSGWMDEPAGADGHRTYIVNQNMNLIGFGHAAAAGCWSTFDFSDSAAFQNGLVIPKVPTASVKPVSGPAGTFRVYATWADPGAGAPKSLNAVVDGVCHAMTLELGKPTLNATYYYDAALAAGCHTYYILGVDAGGMQWTYPTVGALNVPVGNSVCAGDYIGNAPPANCGQGGMGDGGADMTTPADMVAVKDLAAPADLVMGKGDLATPPADMVAVKGDLATPPADMVAGKGDLAMGAADLAVAGDQAMAMNGDLAAAGGDLAGASGSDLAGASGSDLAGASGSDLAGATGNDLAGGKAVDLAGARGDASGGGNTTGGCGCAVGARPRAGSPGIGIAIAIGIGIGIGRRRRKR